MEMNRVEAQLCMELAEAYLMEGNLKMVEKLLHKAIRLFPIQRAQDMLIIVQKIFARNKSETRQPRKRKPLAKPEEPPAPSELYTPEQFKAVKKNKSCKDYYEILGVNKDATLSEIKKAYKKVALQLHPDKNKCPGSSEAFKGIGNAVAVLTDPEKRKQYDLHRSHKERISRNYKRPTHSRGFESCSRQADIFKMVFEESMRYSESFGWRNGRAHKQTASYDGTRHTPPEGKYVITPWVLFAEGTKEHCSPHLKSKSATFKNNY